MKTVFAVCCLLSVCSEFQAARAFTPFSYFSRLGSNRPSRAEAAYLRRGGDAAAAGGDDVGAEAVKRGVRFPWEWSGPMNGVAWDGGKTKSAFEYLGPRLRKSDQPDLPTFPCHNSEWLIYVDGESQCVPPLYDTAYDDEYCIKVDMGPLAGRVVCACERGSTTVAMKDGMDTCVEIDVVRQVGYCGLSPAWFVLLGSGTSVLLFALQMLSGRRATAG
ncbi:uncharacterized protein [Branchiostoma lanceolatum]|uniref:uncharacterized protein isoform X2 n=1 Tax=Branchiostoma lanceolatum TaxID=7740 RepID=UPI003455531D